MAHEFLLYSKFVILVYYFFTQIWVKILITQVVNIIYSVE